MFANREHTLQRAARKPANGHRNAKLAPSRRDSTAFLQRQLGNHRFQRLAATGRPVLQRKCACGGTCAHCSGHDDEAHVQAKLTVGPTGDRYEREADRVADQVMRMPEPQVQRQAAVEEEPEEEMLQTKPLAAQIKPLVQRQPVEEEEEERKLVQAKPLLQRRVQADGGISAPPPAHDILHAPGQPLDTATRAFLEPRFGADFGRVRVHTGSQAALAAQSVGAQAYTVGRHVVFGAGMYAPGTARGQQLLAHELTHVIQQGSAGNADVQRSLLPPCIQRKKEKKCPGGVKTVTVDLVKLDGSNRTPSTDLAFADTVFKPCCVQFTAGANETVNNATTTSWLGDKDLAIKKSCTDVDPEEKKLRTEATKNYNLKSTIRVFYVENTTPSVGGITFHADCSSGDRAPFAGHIYITNAAAKRSLAHEFGHYLLNCGAACDNYKDAKNLMEQSGTATGEELDAGQCAAIHGNA